MSLAIFDLDNTLIAGDSDYLWGEFLVDQGLVDREYHQRENDRYYQDYKNGDLDIYAFLAFSLKPLTEHPLADLLRLRTRYIEDKIRPILLPSAQQLIRSHEKAGDTLLIITATNRFITEPIAKILGINHLIATEPEMDPKGYTGKITGQPCFQQGKVERLSLWLTQNQHDLSNSWFYSDSHNDIPLLDAVTNPVAVDPDPQLLKYAKQKGWKIMSLRETKTE